LWRGRDVIGGAGRLSAPQWRRSICGGAQSK
jgi:hypothetical protein